MKLPAPARKTIRRGFDVEVSEDGWPHWTRLHLGIPVDHPLVTLNHEEARDLHYALGRIVAYLDRVESGQ